MREVQSGCLLYTALRHQEQKSTEHKCLWGQYRNLCAGSAMLEDQLH